MTKMEHKYHKKSVKPVTDQGGHSFFVLQFSSCRKKQKVIYFHVVN